MESGEEGEDGGVKFYDTQDEKDGQQQAKAKRKYRKKNKKHNILTNNPIGVYHVYFVQ